MKINISQIKYRKAKKEDFALLIDYRIKFLKTIEKEYSDDILPELRVELKTYCDRHFKNKSLIGIIAEYDGNKVGWGCMVIRHEPPYFALPDGKTGYIFNMCTLPEFRKNGIGTEMLNRLIKEGVKMGLTKFELHPTPDGENIYRKFGFKKSEYNLLEMVLRR